MSNIKLALCGALVALCICGIAAPTAAFALEWEVNDEALEGGSKVEYGISDAKTFTLSGKVSGSEFEATSSKIHVAKGANIAGGTPGTGEAQLVLEEVKVSKPSKCTIKGGKIETKTLKTEIVEGVGKASVADILYTPKSGSTMAEFTLECGKATSVTLTGSVLAEPSPQGEEATTNKLTFEAASKEYANSKGEKGKAGLEINSASATLTGEATMELNTKESFRALLKFPRFRAQNAGNTNIELKAEPETGLELKLEGSERYIFCNVTGLTYATNPTRLTTPIFILTLEPTYPNCIAKRGTELAMVVTVAECGKLELRTLGRFEIAQRCVFSVGFPGFPNCKITVPANEESQNAVRYENSMTAIKDVQMTIGAGGVEYTTSECGIANGRGELRATVILKGFEPAGTAVGVEYS